MATYVEIRNLFSDSSLLNRTGVATIVAANALLSGAPTAASKAYAAAVFQDPEGEARKVLMAVLSANKALTVAQIQGVTDANLQTAVDAVIPMLRDARAGV